NLVQDCAGRRVETALGQTPVQRHLTSLEALDADAGAGGLPLAPPSGLLALARPDAASDAGAGFGRARIVSHFVELHGQILFLFDHAYEMRDLSDHASDCCCVGDARSASNAIEPKSLQGFPCEAGRPMGLFVCSSVMVFCAVMTRLALKNRR